MLPSNIDLTENHDFGNSSVSLDIRIGGFIDDVFVTADQYEVYEKYTKIFGNTRHKNQAREILGDLYDLPKKDKYGWKTHCHKCGRLLFPWNHNGLCEKCKDTMVFETGKRITTYRHIRSPFPWESSYDLERFPNRIKNIFDLR